MTEIKTSADLLSLVVRMLLPGVALSPPEHEVLLGVAEAADDYAAEAVRTLVVEGDDPLGTALCLLRTAEARRALGAVYTPSAIVRSMVDWAAGCAIPERVVDPGAGSGRFLLAAGQRFPDARLVAIDIDPIALLLLRANAEALGMSGRLDVHCGDYCQAELPLIDGPTLYLGNPPYVRHHDLGADAKAWFGQTAARLGFKASKLAGLHVYFFLRTREVARPGDFGAFITSSEWLDVNYGATVREMLADGLGGAALHVLAPEAMPFEATTTGAITCFEVGRQADTLRFNAVSSISELGSLQGGRVLRWDTVRLRKRWSGLNRVEIARADGMVELGELFHVQRGQVTGANKIWIEGSYPGLLPSRLLHRTVTKAKELINAGEVLHDVARLRRVLDLPCDLDSLTADERLLVDRFLRWAETEGGDKGYIVEHRKAWWSVGLKPPAPIMCTYMARRPPAFVLNPHGARNINISHGLYPREPMDAATLSKYARLLRTTIGIEQGRAYAGGLVKFEPSEVERLRIPPPT